MGSVKRAAQVEGAARNRCMYIGTARRCSRTVDYSINQKKVCTINWQRFRNLMSALYEYHCVMHNFNSYKFIIHEYKDSIQKNFQLKHISLIHNYNIRCIYD